MELIKKVSAHVYAETYLERVSRKSKTPTFRKKEYEQLSALEAFVCTANLTISTCHNEGQLPGLREFRVIKRVWTRSSGRYSEIVDSRCGGWNCRGK